MPQYKKRDIVIVPVPFTDNKTFKRRPALVISDEKVHDTGDVMIVQITSKLKDDGLNVVIESTDVSDPLPLKSYIRCHKIFVLESDLIIKKISALKPHKYKEFIALLDTIVK